MLFALSLPLMDIYSAEDAPANGAPFLCPWCHSRVMLRRTSHQRPHWAHLHRHGADCTLRRDSVSGAGYLRRLAEELDTYAPTGAHD